MMLNRARRHEIGARLQYVNVDTAIYPARIWVPSIGAKDIAV
jgi:hypothetical protein